MTGDFSIFDGMLGKFDNNDPKVFLDRIISELRRFQKDDLLHQILFLVLIPGACVLWLKTNKLIRPQHKTESFESLIQRDLVLTVVATASYVIMLIYLLPTITIFWHFFHTADWEYFFNSLFRWKTVQGIALIIFQVFFSKLAINSFELTDTFKTRYESLEKLAKEEYESFIVAERVRNQILELVPEIIQSLIHQSITAMIATGEFDSASAQEMTRIMKEITHNILLNIDDFDSFRLPPSQQSSPAIEKVRGDISD